MKDDKKKQNYFVQSALKEISLMRKHFHIKGEGDNIHITEEISPNDILSFFTEYFAAVRPPNLSDSKLLPEVDSTRLRCLYFGHPDANLLLNLIVRHCLYVDQIVIADPINDLPFKQIYELPQGWVEVIVNRSLCLCSLESWIKQEIILVIPSVLYYRPQIQQYILKNASAFLSSSQKYDEEFEKYALIRLLVHEPEPNRNSILNIFEKMGRKFSEEKRDELLHNASDYSAKFPIRFRLSQAYYEKHFKNLDMRGQVFDLSTGVPIVIAPDLAEEIGAFLIFEQKYQYEKLISSKAKEDVGNNSAFEQLAIAFQNLDFPFLHNVSLDKALELRKNGYLGRFRVYLRDLWLLSSQGRDDINLDHKIFDFSDRLKSEYSVLRQEWNNIQKELRIKAVTSGLVVGLSAGSTLALGSINVTLSAVAGLGAGLIKEQFNGYSDTAAKLDQKSLQPLFVFLTLEK